MGKIDWIRREVELQEPDSREFQFFLDFQPIIRHVYGRLLVERVVLREGGMSIGLRQGL